MENALSMKTSPSQHDNDPPTSDSANSLEETPMIKHLLRRYTGSDALQSAAQSAASAISPQAQKTTRILNEEKRKIDRQSRDDKLLNTTLRNRSTEFWGDVVQELQPAQFARFNEPLEPPSIPGSSRRHRPDVTLWVKGKLLGQGKYGKFYLGSSTSTAEVFVVKRIEMPDSRSQHQDPRQKQVLNAIKAEYSTLRDLDHPNVVAYLGCEQTERYFSIFMEYVPSESVGQCYRKLGRGFDETLTRHCTKQIVNGLAYLHSKGVLHRDLRADSVLLDLDGTCKISQFAITKHQDDNNADANETATIMQDSVFWTAPEVLVTPEDYDGKIDIWSLGCVVLEMCTGDRPWALQTQLAVLLLLGNKETRQPPPRPVDQNLSAECHDFLDMCFRIDPTERSTAEQLQSHSYLKKKLDWRLDWNYGSLDSTSLVLVLIWAKLL